MANITINGNSLDDLIDLEIIDNDDYLNQLNHETLEFEDLSSGLSFKDFDKDDQRQTKKELRKFRKIYVR